ncbi:MAG: geopeptide radical SAM maturase [Thermodesulfovibrionales bacterium]
MHISSYCKIFPANGSGKSFLIYSTKNAAIAEVPAALLRRIQKGQSIPEKDERLLRRLGVLVADPVRGKKRMLGFMDALNRASRFLSIKLVMNLDCNLSCRYCFEGNRKGKFYMTENTSDQFVEFVKSRLGEKIEEVFITFYGGEPLLSKQLIISVAKKLKAMTERRGVSFRFALQTNGTLLTKKTVRELRPLGLAEAYVTVDGPKSNHDAFRPHKSGRGSFETIIKNMQDVCDLVDLQPGGNFTRDNYEQFPTLLDHFIASGLTPDKLSSVSFYTVVSETADVLPDFNEGCSSMSEPWLVGAALMLREEILKRGYRMTRLLPVVCMMEHKSNILVNYNGDIYKCPSLIGRKEFCVGNIRSGIYDFQASHNLDNWKNKDCLNCEYLPLCFGGCRYMKYIRDGNMNGVECKKPYLDATLEAMVKQDIKYGLTSA